MRIVEWNPKDGQAFQGDIAIVPIPASIKISTVDEIKPVDGRLIIQEGEVSGHHHAVDLRHNFHQQPAITADPLLATRSPQLRRALARKATTAKLYRDPEAVQALVRSGILTRADLAIGMLVVEGAPIVISHEEHDGIRVPAGRYYVGRQVESAGAEERVVAD